jgi:general secretion pathway protein A
LQNRLPDNADVAVVLNPRLSAIEFLETICEELGILEPEFKGSTKALVDALNKQLLQAYSEGRRVILVVDEAQNLSRDVLEQVRLLTNLETAKQKLLQIILIGQPELRDLLSRDDLRQLAQRITGRYHLEPLSRDETAQYVDHRLRVAGALGEVFESGAKVEVFRLTDGVPRLINVISDRALLGAYSREQRRVSRRLVRRAAAEIKGEPFKVPWLRWAMPALAAVAVVVIGASLWSLAGDQPVPASPAATPAAAPSEDAPTQEVVAEMPLAEPEPEPEPEPTLDEQLLLAEGLTGAEAAFRALFDLWGLDYENGDACEIASRTGHACLVNRGSWSRLRQLDRPAILTLTDSRGNTHRIVLAAMQGDRAELSIAGVSVTHPVSNITDMWFGQYALLWKPPNGRAFALGPGSRGRNVVWLRESLSAIDERYRAEPLNSDEFDADLEVRVRDFQRDNRLDVDGLAGRQTQIIINSLLAADGTPRLTTPRLARD